MFVTEFVIGVLNWRESSSSPQKKTDAPRNPSPVDLRSRPRAKKRQELYVSSANKPITGSAVRVKVRSASIGTCSCSANGADHACHPMLSATMSESYHRHLSWPSMRRLERKMAKTIAVTNTLLKKVSAKLGWPL